MENKSRLGMAAVTLAVGLLVGGGIGYAMNSNDNDDGQENSAQSSIKATDTKPADLRAVLNNLEAEHVDLASAATRAGFDGSPMFTAAAASLGTNTDNLSAAVASVYGEEAGAQFKEIWASHIGFFVDYTVAAKAGNTAGMAKAVENLNGYVEAISAFLSGANPNLPKEAVAALITEHVGLLKETVDKHGAGDYAGSYDAQMRTRTQVTTKVADTLAGAIVKQYPEKF
ncbi:hypothetical protein H0V99_03680 [Candidatus Saccharibacteria bacterium]|nr:hypothetical protein [Candidatus Saccharibacteria bacterium]